MTNPADPTSGTASAHGFDEELVFKALASVARRKLLVAIARGGPQTVADLVKAGRAPRGQFSARMHLIDSTGKNLKIMVDAGLVVQQVNPVDGRKPLHALAPELKVSFNDDVTIVDGGSWVVRLSEDGN